MCNCHKRCKWTVTFEFDAENQAKGYDGDVPLPTDRDWRCYTIVVRRRCTRCHEESVHDSLGCCWASNDAAGDRALREDVDQYKMLPRGIAWSDVEVYYAEAS